MVLFLSPFVGPYVLLLGHVSAWAHDTRSTAAARFVRRAIAVIAENNGHKKYKARPSRYVSKHHMYGMVD